MIALYNICLQNVSCRQKLLIDFVYLWLQVVWRSVSCQNGPHSSAGGFYCSETVWASHQPWLWPWPMPHDHHHHHHRHSHHHSHRNHNHNHIIIIIAIAITIVSLSRSQSMAYAITITNTISPAINVHTSVRVFVPLRLRWRAGICWEWVSSVSRRQHSWLRWRQRLRPWFGDSFGSQWLPYRGWMR